MAQPKILFLDIETSYIISAHFGLFKTNINYDCVLHNTYMICAAWQWAHEKTVRSVSVLDNKKLFNSFNYDVRNLNFNDFHVVSELHKVIEQADILVAHNGDRFDMKKFNSRVIYHGLPPISKKMTIDTLKAVRQIAAFDSNKLDALCGQLDLSTKMSTEPGLWLGATLGDVKSIKTMVKYNRQDIPPLRELYYKLRPYMKSHPNMGLFAPERGLICPKCGSGEYQARGKVPFGSTIKRRYSCKDCETWFQGKQAVDTVEGRL